MSRPLSGAVASWTRSPDETRRMPRSRSADLEVAEERVERLGVDAADRSQLGSRERPLGDEQERLEVRDADRRQVGRGSAPRQAPALEDVIERRVRLRPPRSSRRAGRSCGHDPRQRIGPNGTSCSTVSSRALHELEHRQERDRDDDPVARRAEQVLEHDDAVRGRWPRG